MCMQLRIACIADRCGILSVLKHRIMGFGVGDCEYRPLQYLQSRMLGEDCIVVWEQKTHTVLHIAVLWAMTLPKLIAE